MRQKMKFTAALLYCYAAGWLVYNGFDNVGKVFNPETAPAYRHILTMALGVPLLLLQIAVIKYTTELTKNI